MLPLAVLNRGIIRKPQPKLERHSVALMLRRDE